MPLFNDLSRLIASIDAKDLPTFQSFIHPKGSFTYGSQPTAVGKEAVEQYVGGFFKQPFGMKHEVHQSWQADKNTIFVRGTVTYLLDGGREVPVEFLNYFQLEDDLIKDYRVYIDPSPLYAALTG